MTKSQPLFDAPKKARKEEPEGFTEFWEIWRPHQRHTDGRGLARETFSKHVKNGADPQDIIDGARYFFRSMKERDKEYVPLSSTWMNRGSFEDLAEQERNYERQLQERLAKRAAETSTVVQLPAHHFMSRRQG
ncbi:hypothetical protein [Agrobacterium rosae]